MRALFMSSMVLVAAVAIAGPPARPAPLSADVRSQLAYAHHVVADAGKVVKCAETPATTCARVTLKIERSLKGSLSGEVTVRTDGLAPKTGRAVFFLADGSFGLQLMGRSPAVIPPIEAALAAMCAAPREGERCHEAGAWCEVGGERACVCAAPPSGIARPVDAPRFWSCEPIACFGMLSGACDGGVQCKWSFCNAGQWDRVPPPP